MHQLTKDPKVILFQEYATEEKRNHMTSTQLMRYLDYCCDLLAVIGKIAALHAQNFNDPVVLNAVNDIESLTTGLSSKIWQKIKICKQ